MFEFVCLIVLAWFVWRTIKRIRRALNSIERKMEDKKLSVQYIRHDQEKAQKRITEKIEKVRAIRDDGDDDYEARVTKEIEEITK